MVKTKERKLDRSWTFHIDPAFNERDPKAFIRSRITVHTQIDDGVWTPVQIGCSSMSGATADEAHDFALGMAMAVVKAKEMERALGELLRK